MKEFNKYIINKLNEDNEQDSQEPVKYDNANKTIQIKLDATEEQVYNWLKDRKDKIKSDGKFLIYRVASGKYKIFNHNKNVDIYQLFDNLDSELKYRKEIKIIPTEQVNKMGEAIGYRCAIAVMKSETDIKNVIRDIFEDKSEYSIKTLVDLPTFFSYASALYVTLTIMNKSEKETTKKIYKTMAENIEAISTREEAISDIKEKHKEEFEKAYKMYQNHFNQGLIKIRTEMRKPDFQWKDPVTGATPTGIKGKASEFFGKKIAQIGALGEALYKKIPAQHTLENDLARLACVGVKALIKGVESISDFIRSFANWNSFRKEMKKNKLNKVDDEIDKFLKDYNNWEKQKQKTENYNFDKLSFNGKLIVEAEEQDQKRAEILNKFNNLMRTYVIPYYYYKMSNIISMFEHKDKQFIIEYSNKGWSTFNTPNGSLTMVEDNRNLMMNFMNLINKKLSKPLETFKEDLAGMTVDLVPNEISFNKNIANNFQKFLTYFEPKLDLENMLKIYNEDVIKNKYEFKNKKYSDLMTYFIKAKSVLNDGKDIKPLIQVELKLKENKPLEELKVNVPGVLLPQTIEDEENQEELNILEIKKTLKQVDQDFLKANDDLSNSDNNITKLKNNIIKIKSELDDWLKTEEGQKAEKTFEKLDYPKELIPMLYKYNKLFFDKDVNLVSKMESYDYQLLLDLLNEDNESPTVVSQESIKKLIDKFENLAKKYSNLSIEEFNKEYLILRKECEKITDESIKDNEDPYVKLCKMYNLD